MGVFAKATDVMTGLNARTLDADNNVLHIMLTRVRPQLKLRTRG